MKEFREIFEIKLKTLLKYYPQEQHEDIAKDALFHCATETTKENSKIDFEFFKVISNIYSDDTVVVTVKDALDQIDRKYKDAVAKRLMVKVREFCNFRQNDTAIKDHVENWKELLTELRRLGFVPQQTLKDVLLMDSLRDDIVEKCYLKNAETEDKILTVLEELAKVESITSTRKPKPFKSTAAAANETGGRGRNFSSPKFGTCNNCGKPGHYARECRLPKKEGRDENNSKKREKSFERKKCSTCHKLGHTTENCYRNKNKKKEEKEKTTSTETPHNGKTPHPTKGTANCSVKVKEWACFSVEKGCAQAVKEKGQQKLFAMIDSACNKPLIPLTFEEYKVPGTESEVFTEFEGALEGTSDFTTRRDADFILPFIDKNGKTELVKIRGAIDESTSTRILLPPPEKFEMDRKKGVHRCRFADTVLEGEILHKIPVLEIGAAYKTTTSNTDEEGWTVVKRKRKQKKRVRFDLRQVSPK